MTLVHGVDEFEIGFMVLVFRDGERECVFLCEVYSKGSKDHIQAKNQPDFVSISSAGHILLERRLGTEQPGGRPSRRRVAEEQKMAPDASLHPGQFAFASAEGDEGASSPPIADRPMRDAFVSRRAGRRANVSLCLGRFLREHRGRVRPDCGPDDTSLSRRGTSGSHRHEPVLPDGPASRKTSFAKLASFQ